MTKALRRSEPGGDLHRSEEWIIVIGARRLTFSKKQVDDDAHDQRANKKLWEVRDLIDLVGLEEDDAAGNTDARAMSRHQVHALSTMNLESERQVRVNLGRVDRAVHVGRSLCEGLCIGIAYELTAIRMDTRSHERE